ncbi:alpha/beta-hydrolase [Colletotrichum somersetense]|nr:alpha/beta-hydrolase [Colletotrichum somersetense]
MATTQQQQPQQVILPDGRVLSYDLSGPDSKPIVLLANPLSAPFALWDRVVEVLHDNGFRTLRFDQPGHGKSSAPKALDTEFETIADDVHFLVTSLKVDKLFAWVGVSMGAATSFYFVTKYPGMVHKLAICDTISSSPKLAGVEDAFGARAKAAGEAGNMQAQVEQTMERWFGADWVKANPDEARRARAIMNQTTVEGFQTCCHALQSDKFDIRPLFERVGSGVDEALLIVGEKDANLPQAMEGMREKVEAGFKAAGKDRKIELKVIPEAGHAPFVDNFGQFKEVLLGYLKA